MKFILILIIGCLLVIPNPLNADNVNNTENNNVNNIYTLDQLLELTVKHNLLLKISHLDRGIARQEYRETRALPNPELEYATGKLESDERPENPTIWGAGVKWSLPNPIQRHFLLQAGKKNISAAEIDTLMRQKELTHGVKTYYFQLRLYLKIKSFLEEEQRILQEVHKITKAKVSIGETKSIDALRSSVEIQKIKTQLFKIQKTINYARIKINEFLNFTLPDDFDISREFTFNPLPPMMEKRLKSLIEKSPLVRLKSAQLDKAAAHHRAASFSLIEEVELFAEKEKEAEGAKWKIGVGVAIPLFDQKGAHRKKARLERQKAKMEYEHAKKHFFADVQQTLSQIRVLEEEIKTFQGAILKEGKQNMELSETLYRAGEVPLVVFLDSQNSFFEIQGRYYEAITEWNLLKSTIEEQLGEDL